MDSYLIRTAPDLQKRIKAEDDKNKRETKKNLPKYIYPDETLTVSELGYMCKHGIDFRVKKNHCFFIRSLDSQKRMDKGMFGGGFLLSEKAAAEKAAAEKAAAEKAAAENDKAEKWELSEREWEIIKSLGKE